MSPRSQCHWRLWGRRTGYQVNGVTGCCVVTFGLQSIAVGQRFWTPSAVSSVTLIFEPKAELAMERRCRGA